MDSITTKLAPTLDLKKHDLRFFRALKSDSKGVRPPPGPPPGYEWRAGKASPIATLDRWPRAGSANGPSLGLQPSGRAAGRGSWASQTQIPGRNLTRRPIVILLRLVRLVNKNSFTKSLLLGTKFELGVIAQRLILGRWVRVAPANRDASLSVDDRVEMPCSAFEFAPGRVRLAFF
jgi:hypothetical protein